MIKNIVFDVGMVLIDFCWREYCRDLGFSEDIVEKFGENVVLTDIWNQLDHGTISLEEANGIFKQRIPECADKIDLFWEKQEGMVKEYDYSLPLVLELKSKGYHVYLLSNYPKDMYEHQWPGFRFLKEVDGYIVSSLEKRIKPNPDIYELLCERYHLLPEECLFVDDRLENVEAAIGCGMQAVVFENYEAFRRDLLKVGVLK